jgi:phage gp45-like
MAHLNNTMVHGLLDVTEQIVLREEKYNVAKYSNGLLLGEDTIATNLVGKGITLTSSDAINLLASAAVLLQSSKETITINASSKGITITAKTDITESADGAVKITGATGATITGNGTTGVKLDGTRLCIPAVSYGTGEPPTSGAQTGQVYFKIIS